MLLLVSNRIGTGFIYRLQFFALNDEIDYLYCQNSLTYAILLMKQGRCEVRIVPLNSTAQTNQTLSY